MKDLRYLLCIKELLDESTKDTLLKAVYEKLDSERKRKLENITNERKRAESSGAGLLLQLAMQEQIHREEVSVANETGIERMEVPVAINTDVQLFTVSQVLKKLGSLIDIEYDYSEKGKPAFRNIPMHFNLSHSGEYVFLVVSEQEIGVDIQYKRTFYNERILRRFFTKKEQELWNAYETAEKKEEFFYRMWIRKEAYGKLTGEGISKAVSENVTEEAEISKLGVCFEHYDMLPNYQMAVCKWAEKKE